VISVPQANRSKFEPARSNAVREYRMTMLNDKELQQAMSEEVRSEIAAI